ncbi:MAG: hydrogenase iron-sulfur subunit [Methanomassiliicoccales archaeon]|nr:hydrogenase iron-sulfur subunit [Methanomassiliicoccales archaeon]
MNDNCIAAVKIDQDLCSRCKVCYSLCPFEAIDQRPEDGRIMINIQKCQVCGICYSACPVSAIEMAYYDYDDLLEHVRSSDEKAETLVMMCRGNSPSSGEVQDILASNGLSADRYIPLRVPCAGRIPTDFVFKALQSGIKNIVSVQCRDGFCRMKEGTSIETRRLLLGMAVIEQLGYPRDTLKVVKYSRKAFWINKECVGCDKCVFVCPYGAIRAEPFSSPTIDNDKCTGCGACQMVCPHSAIQVKGFEFDKVLGSYAEAAVGMKARSSKPAVLVFSCQWSEFSALDDPEKMLKGKNAMVLEVPCFKSMDPVHVINALRHGFDGVMAVVCSAQDCKLQNGRDTAERQLEVLQKSLKKLGLLDRFEIHELSPRCEGEFAMKFEAFCEKIAAKSTCAVAAQRRP